MEIIPWAENTRTPLRRGQLIRIASGFYVHRGEWESASPEERFLAVLRAEGRRHVLTGRSVAALLSLPVPRDARTVDLAITSHGHAGRQSIPGLPFPFHRHIMQPQTELIGGLRCAPVAFSLAKALTLLDYRDAQALADACVRGREVHGRRDLPSLDEILSALESTRWRLGRRTAITALKRASALCESPGESRSRAIMIEWGMPLPQLQKEIRLPNGRIYRPDFLWEGRKLIGEFDGHVKYSRALTRERGLEEVLRRERQREVELIEAGYTVIRWKWSDLNGRTPALVSLLRKHLGDVAHP